MAATFTERDPGEAGFAAVFSREIAPRLAALEEQRLSILIRRRNRLLGVAGVALGILAAIWAGLGDERELAIILSAFVAFGALAATVLVRSFGQEAFEARVKDEIMPPIAAYLGLRFDPRADERPDPAPFVEAGLISSHQRAGFSDGVAGVHRGVEFAACQAHFTRSKRESDGDGKTRTKTVTVFSGVIATFSVPRPAPGLIVIRADAGALLNNLLGFFERAFKGLERVEIAHPGFEEAFEVRAENPQAAAAFVTGPFLDGLLALSRGEGEDQSRPVSGAFVGDRFLLAVPGLSLVPIGPVSESLDEIEPRLHAMLAGMRFPRRVIDRFHGG